MEIVERLVAFRDYTGLSNSQFADKAAIPRPTLSQFLNGRNKRLSDDMTAKLHQAYPELNIMWLLFGEGSMLKDNIAPTPATATSAPESSADNAHDELTEDAAGAPNLFSKSYNESPMPSSTADSVDIDKVADSFFTIEDYQKLHNSSPTPDTPRRSINAQGYAAVADPAKKISYITVFYTDNSYETFMPK